MRTCREYTECVTHAATHDELRFPVMFVTRSTPPHETERRTDGIEVHAVAPTMLHEAEAGRQDFADEHSARSAEGV